MATTAPAYLPEPPAARWLFGSGKAAWIWLIARIWLGWEWLAAGWGKTFGGQITWRFWDWAKPAYSLTGAGSIGWVRNGTIIGADGVAQARHIGDAVAGYAAGAIQAAQGPHPAVAYSWYVEFLKWVQHTAAPVIGPMVAIGELVIGAALILGLFTGIVTILGALLNFTYVFAGSAGPNPAMILVSIGLILAWRNAGWLGMDRFLLPRFGVPWHREALRPEAAEPGATSRPLESPLTGATAS
jgi:thiosulfate dehydrogenase [quinone] large subunit